MTKYYFISYACVLNDGNLAYGNCTAKITDCSLKQIEDLIRKDTGMDVPLKILHLKDLTKEEYEMLKGGQDND